MPANPKSHLAETFKGKSAQEIQDQIFSEMSADQKVKFGSKLWLLAKELDPGKIDFRKNGNRSAPSARKSR